MDEMEIAGLWCQGAVQRRQASSFHAVQMQLIMSIWI